MFTEYINYTISTRFCLDFGTVPTVWYFFNFIFITVSWVKDAHNMQVYAHCWYKVKSECTKTL